MTQNPTPWVPGDVGSFRVPLLSVSTVMYLCANELLQAVQLFLCCPGSWYLLHGRGLGQLWVTDGEQEAPPSSGQRHKQGQQKVWDRSPHHARSPQPLVLLTVVLGWKVEQDLRGQARAGTASALALHRPLPCQVLKPLLRWLVVLS